MTDFLVRMVERAMGRTSVVQPLVAPIFAPGPTMAESRHDEMYLETIEQDYKSSAAESDPVVSIQKQVVSMPATLASGKLTEGSTSPAASEHPATRVGRRGKKDYSQAVTHADSDCSETVTTIVPKQSDPANTPPPLDRHETFTIASHFVKRREKQFITDLLMGKHRVSPGFKDEEHQAEESGNDGRTASSTSSAEGIRPQIIMGISEKNIPASAAFPSAPTIKVSIGRIEVRAITQQPAPAKRYAPQAPKVSLDEYLKKQSEGKR